MKPRRRRSKSTNQLLAAQQRQKKEHPQEERGQGGRRCRLVGGQFGIQTISSTVSTLSLVAVLSYVRAQIDDGTALRLPPLRMLGAANLQAAASGISLRAAADLAIAWQTTNTRSVV